MEVPNSQLSMKSIQLQVNQLLQDLASKLSPEDETYQFWWKFTNRDMPYIMLYFAMRTGSWELRVAALKNLAPSFPAFSHPCTPSWFPCIFMTFSTCQLHSWIITKKVVSLSASPDLQVRVLGGDEGQESLTQSWHEDGFACSRPTINGLTSFVPALPCYGMAKYQDSIDSCTYTYTQINGTLRISICIIWCLQSEKGQRRWVNICWFYLATMHLAITNSFSSRHPYIHQLRQAINTHHLQQDECPRPTMIWMTSNFNQRELLK